MLHISEYSGEKKHRYCLYVNERVYMKGKTGHANASLCPFFGIIYEFVGTQAAALRFSPELHGDVSPLIPGSVRVYRDILPPHSESSPSFFLKEEEIHPNILTWEQAKAESEKNGSEFLDSYFQLLHLYEPLERYKNDLDSILNGIANFEDRAQWSASKKEQVFAFLMYALRAEGLNRPKWVEHGVLKVPPSDPDIKCEMTWSMSPDPEYCTITRFFDKLIGYSGHSSFAGMHKLAIAFGLVGTNSTSSDSKSLQEEVIAHWWTQERRNSLLHAVPRFLAADKTWKNEGISALATSGKPMESTQGN